MNISKILKSKHNEQIKCKTKILTHMRLIFFSYLLIILLGGIVLYLPISQNYNIEHMSFLNCFFTATSAVCVTGLIIAPTALQWTLFGKITILLLIQIGGLSIIAITSFIFIIIGKKIRLKDRLLLQNTLNQNQFGGIVKMTLTVIKGTLFFEICGTLILTVYFVFVKHISFAHALFIGIFHSVSALCNAGFDVLGTNSLIDYSGDIVVNFVLMSLIIIGGIGFFVWEDVLAKLKDKHHRLHFTSRLAIRTSIILIVLGALFFVVIEYNNEKTIGLFSLPHKLLASLFQSVTLRTAGFVSIDQFGLRDISKLFSSILMMIGGSPGGIAGGIKTTTVVVLIASIWSTIQGKEDIELLNRSIPTRLLRKALAVTGIMLSLLFSSSILLSLVETNSTFTHDFLDILYECSSALGTVGLTTGITPYLSNIGKLIIISAMIIGRVGPITAIYALSNIKTNSNSNSFGKLPEADTLIG